MGGTPAAEKRITPELVRALLEDQHPRFASLSLRLAGEGWDNVMFRLGDDLAVRVPRRQLGADLLLTEQLCLASVAPRLPLPVPAPIAIGQPGRGFPWTWSVIPWLDGTTVDEAPLDLAQGRPLAGFLRALHQPATGDAPTNPYRGVHLAARREIFEPVLARLRASSDVVTPAVERAWREALDAPVAAARVWIHGDLHPQNVLSKDGRLAGVIDWGDMGGGDPAVDLASVWGLLGDASARDEALRAYAPDDALLARARGWAVVFGALLVDTGRVDNPRHAASGRAILERLTHDA